MNINKTKRIFIIAGEPSGDQHASRLIRHYTEQNKNIIVDAYGQNELKKTGANMIYDTEKISVVGVIEVLSKINTILDALKIAKNHIKDTKPNLIILVDYVEFNLKIAKYARSLNIPVLFYIAPQLWAWREKRARSLIENINYLAVIFPFEELFFKKYTKDVSFVGHPLFKNNNLLNSVKSINERSIDLGIFPGSRESEIKNNIHMMLDCLQNKKEQNIAIFYANKTCLELLEKLLPDNYHPFLKSGDDIDAISNCKKAICASGTITLQLAILEVPMVIMYKLSYITYFVMKILVQLKHIGLVNLVLGSTIGSKPIVKEYIQPSYSDQIDAMVELNKIDNDNEYREDMINMFREIKSSLSCKSQDNLNGIIDRLLNTI